MPSEAQDSNLGRSGRRMLEPGNSVTEWPIGLTVYDRNRCWPGYTLLSPFGSPIVYLLDMNGDVVHMWFTSMGSDEAERMTMVAKYIGDGHILFKPHFTVVETWGEDVVPGLQKTWLCEVDWEGNVVWSYRPNGPPDDPHNARETLGWDPLYRPFMPHHDFQHLPNGNTLILGAVAVTNPDISDYELRSDYFVEVTPEGEPVWVWHSDQHFDEFGFSEEARRLIREAPGIHSGVALGDYLHTNTVEVLPDTELGRRDRRFRVGNILGCQRCTNTIFIVDKESGVVVWTWGPDELVGPHHPNMLPDGNILVYDNGGLAGYPRRTRAHTRLVELDPVSGEIVWTYRHDPRGMFHHKFFSSSWGSVQRLPNGNTFSLDANLGRLFEVTPDGDIVWEYVNGFMGMFRVGGTKLMGTGVYRCYRVPHEAVPDFSAEFPKQLPAETTLLRHPPIG